MAEKLQKNFNKTLQLTIPSNPRYIKIVRSVLESLGQLYDYSEKDIHSIVLATNEACANIINHAYQNEHDHNIKIIISGFPNKISVELIDQGIHVDPEKIKPRKLKDVRPGGLGVHLMRTLMDEVIFDQEHGNENHLILIKERNKKDESRIGNSN